MRAWYASKILRTASPALAAAGSGGFSYLATLENAMGWAIACAIGSVGALGAAAVLDLWDLRFVKPPVLHLAHGVLRKIAVVSFKDDKTLRITLFLPRWSGDQLRLYPVVRFYADHQRRRRVSSKIGYIGDHESKLIKDAWENPGNWDPKQVPSESCTPDERRKLFIKQFGASDRLAARLSDHTLFNVRWLSDVAVPDPLSEKPVAVLSFSSASVSPIFDLSDRDKEALKELLAWLGVLFADDDRNN